MEGFVVCLGNSTMVVPVSKPYVQQMVEFVQ